MKRILTTNINNKRRDVRTGMFKIKNKKQKQNKIQYGKLQDDKTHVKLPMKSFHKYSFLKIRFSNNYNNKQLTACLR